MDHQDAHSISGARDNKLEVSIGRQVRTFRKKLDLTVSGLANLADLSKGMLSQIENGLTSASLATLQSLVAALHIPVTALFQKYEEERIVSFVRAGEGIAIERRGTRSGHQYELLGHSSCKTIAVEPNMITLTKDTDVFPIFHHSGMEFINMIEGEVGYRHGTKTYSLTPGDSLFFDADAPHGPEELKKLPIRFLSVIAYSRFSEE